MDELDKMIEATLKKPEESSSSFFDKPTANIETTNYVVIDEKVFAAGYLFHAVSKGNTTISLKNGKGINFVKFKGNDGKDWVKIQIIDAGIGKSVAKQTASFVKKTTTKKNMSFEAPKEQTKKLAWWLDEM